MTNPRMSLLQLLDKAEAGADPESPRRAEAKSGLVRSLT